MSLPSFLAHMTDPRQPINQTYTFDSLIFLIFSAAICGYDHPRDIVEFGHLKLSWLNTYVPLKKIPCEETIRSFMAALKPEELITAFKTFACEAQLNHGNDIVAIDGKTMRGNAYRGSEAIHVISAWSVKHGITLCALKSTGKKNEIRTIPDVLDQLDIKEATVTLDAMGCQRDIAKKITVNKANYCLQVKDNQKSLHNELNAYYHRLERDGYHAVKHDKHESVDKSHGRIEVRKYHQIELSEWTSIANKWPNATTLIRAERARIINGEENTHISWYLSSLAVNAKESGDAIRGHWAVENNLHWQLDVTFREDDRRIVDGALNVALLKRFCMNLLKSHDTTKRRSMKQRMLHAAMDDNYRLRALMGVNCKEMG